MMISLAACVGLEKGKSHFKILGCLLDDILNLAERLTKVDLYEVLGVEMLNPHILNDVNIEHLNSKIAHLINKQSDTTAEDIQRVSTLLPAITRLDR